MLRWRFGRWKISNVGRRWQPQRVEKKKRDDVGKKGKDNGDLGHFSNVLGGRNPPKPLETYPGLLLQFHVFNAS